MTIRPYRHSIPPDILALSHERDLLRRKGQYGKADLLKQQLEEAGYVVKDNPRGAHLVVLPGVTIDGEDYRTTQYVPSLLTEPDRCTFSFIILAQNSKEQTRRCLESVQTYAHDASYETILIDNASLDGLDIWAEVQQRKDTHLHLIRAARKVGVAEAYNLGLKQSSGRYIIILDTQLELAGDVLSPIAATFENEDVGLTGPRGLRTEDLRHFEDSDEDEVEAVNPAFMVFRRSLLQTVGFFDEGYRSPHFMNIDFSFAVRDAGARIVRTPDLPLQVQSQSTPEVAPHQDAQQSRLDKRNFYRYLNKWGDRDDLLLDGYGDEDEYDDEDDFSDEDDDDQI